MESPPPLSCYIPQTPKRRVFPGSSSTYMDDEVVEISPPANRSSSAITQKHKEVMFPEIIDLEMDEDCTDMRLDDKKANKNGKGKEVIPKFPLGSSSGIKHGYGKGGESLGKNYASGSEYLIDGDDFGADLFYGENEVLYEENTYMDLYFDDYLFDDQYAFAQSHLDGLDIPPGVEVPLPWFTDHQENKMKSTVANTLNFSSSPGFPYSDSPLSTLPKELGQHDKSTSGDILNVGTMSKELPQPKMWESSSSRLLKPFGYHRTRAAASSSGKEPLMSYKPELLKSHTPSMSESGSFGKFSTHIRRTKKQFGDGGASDPYRHKQPKVQTGAAVSELVDMQSMLKTSLSCAQYKIDFFDPSSLVPTFPMSASSAPVPLFSGKEKYGVPDEFLKRFELFKRFDVVEDFSDHHYSKNHSSVKQPPKAWAKKIQDEWRILENDLPDTISVRVYESRMDLLRAVIIGAEGTPYHDGLFFFDVFFPTNYPQVPPLVYYQSRGHRINPNLYNNGKVCLSLLNTWNGGHKERWIPGQSTILQVLVSIQGLILNSKPFFNEPGYANLSGSLAGEKSSLQYNENTFILSLKTMVGSIRNPPKYFEDFVAGHFFSHARDILVACKAYIEGAQVGCLVKGGVQDVDEGDSSCSKGFKNNLAGYIKTLVDTFKAIGANDCDEFLSLASKTSETKPGTRHPFSPAYAEEVPPYANFNYM